MLKKNITFTNLDGVTVTKEFHFHLGKGELAEIAVAYNGDYSEWLKDVLARDDRKTMVETYKMLIIKSVGRRVGDYFEKTEELTAEFMGCGAYDELFMELFSDPMGGVTFIKGVFPEDMTKALDVSPEMQKIVADVKALEASKESVELPDDGGVRDPNSYTHAELENMSQSEFEATFGSDPNKWSKRVLVAAMARKTAR